MSADLNTRRCAIMAYARSCLDAGDYHGCRDACTDLEVIEARLQERAGRVEPVSDAPPKVTHNRSGYCGNCGRARARGEACYCDMVP